MATFDVNTQVRKVTATANGSNTDFDFAFQVNATSDIDVYVDNVLQTSGFSIVDSSNVAGLNTNGTGRVKFTTAPTNGKIVAIKSDVPLGRTSVYTAGGNITATSLETDFDTIAMKVGDADETLNRAVKAPVGDPDDIDMTLPAKASRLGKVLGFNATSGQPEAGPTIADVQTLAAITADIGTLADIEDGTDATDAIQTVAGISSNVTTVAGINTTHLANVSGKATEIGRLGTADAVSDMNTLGTADAVSDMNTLAAISADITTLAHVEDGTDATDAIQTVATNITAVQGASQAATDAATARDSAKAIAAAMGAALDNFDDRYLGTMADTKTAVSSVTPTITTTNGSADVTVSSATGIIVGMKLTSANIPAGTNVIGISGTTISLDNAATAAASGTSSTFSAHGVFGAFNTSTDGPSTDNDGDSLLTGSLYYNTTDNEMRVYDGANWIAASAAGSASMNIFEYTVSGSPTATFSGTDDNSATLSYTQGNIQVVKDGVILHADDFTATNGTSVVLGANAAVGSEIVIYAFKSFTVADTVSKSSGGTFTGAVTFTGADMNGTELILDADGDTSITSDTDDQINFKTGNSDTLTLDKGNTILTDADLALVLGTSGQSNTALQLRTGTSGTGKLWFGDNSGSDNGRYDGYIQYSQTNRNMVFGVKQVQAMELEADGSNRPRVNVGGDDPAANSFFTVSGDNGAHVMITTNNTNPSSGGGAAVRFKVLSNTTVGQIGTSNTSTTYSTSSDHRLKENVEDMSGAIERVKQLSPKRFSWVADELDSANTDGFLAHEAQAVVPQSVIGTHNEVDDDNNPVYQQIDASMLVPLLTGALQEAIAKIETLETKVAALEGN